MGWSVAQNGEKEMSNGQNGAELRLVTPGMAIGPVAGKRVGSGAIAQNDTIIATRLGWTKEFNNTVSIFGKFADREPKGLCDFYSGTLTVLDC